MPELKEGQILTLDEIQNNTYTYRGQELKFEKSDVSPSVFTAKTTLSQEEKDQGNLERHFAFNAGTASGTVISYVAPPDTGVFKELSDSEKVTKLNSIAYQHNTNEPVDTGDGLDTVLQKNLLTAQPAKQEDFEKVQKQQLKALKTQEGDEEKKLSQQTKKVDAPVNPQEGQIQNKPTSSK